MEKKPRAALWRTLYTPGHDAALVAPFGAGWQVTGTAAFLGPDGPVSVSYSVEADADWRAWRGSIRGFAGTRGFFHAIERTAQGWMLDGRPNGLAELDDLDFGFTPATNIQQLSRVNLEIGERAEFPVAWFDIGKKALSALPQIYERRDETRYRYDSPTSGYEAMLETDPATGFVHLYPGLWEIVG